MATQEQYPVLTDADLGGVSFTTVACHNCRSSCSKESPVMYRGQKVVVCAERFMVEVLDQRKPKRKGPPVFVVVPFAAAAVLIAVSLVVSLLS